MRTIQPLVCLAIYSDNFWSAPLLFCASSLLPSDPQSFKNLSISLLNTSGTLAYSNHLIPGISQVNLFSRSHQHICSSLCGRELQGGKRKVLFRHHYLSKDKNSPMTQEMSQSIILGLRFSTEQIRSYPHYLSTTNLNYINKTVNNFFLIVAWVDSFNHCYITK